MKPTKKASRHQLAYKVMVRHADDGKPVGTILLFDEWLGQRHTFQTYNFNNIAFYPTMTVRYLGRITARTDQGKIRQMMALPGTSHLKASAAAIAR
jgi:hypothetical protein